MAAYFVDFAKGAAPYDLNDAVSFEELSVEAVFASFLAVVHQINKMSRSNSGF